MRILLLLVALLSASEWVLAQSRSRSDPADPSAAAPRPAYQPAFSDYQPFRDEPVRSWKEVNKEVADNPGMGAMKHGSGTTMPGGGHDMGSMQQKPGASMPGMDKPAATTPKSKVAAAGHDMGAMKGMPGKPMPGMDKPGHDRMAMAKPSNATGQAAKAHTAGITGSGIVQAIDKANDRVKLTHEPIAAMGWPKMTMFFRLKERSLSDQVKEGDRVGFTLEKTASGYVISGFQKPISESNPAVEAPKPTTGHGKH